jgi:hypothetical protein
MQRYRAVLSGDRKTEWPRRRRSFRGLDPERLGNRSKLVAHLLDAGSEFDRAADYAAYNSCVVEQFQHPNGQLPAYEWEFSDLNPPVHGWAVWRVYNMDRIRNGHADRECLRTVRERMLIAAAARRQSEQS